MKKDYLIIPASFSIVMVVFIFLAANQPKPTILSPAAIPLQAQPTPVESPQSLLYYLNASQELLNKARILSANTQQSEAEKQEILDTIKLALEFISKGIAIYPDDDRVFAQRAAIYEAVIPLNAGFRKAAISDFERAVAINRQNPAHLQKLANLYLQIPDFSNAARVWYKAHLLSPVDVQLLYNLADALEKSGQTVPSFHYFQKLTGLLPENDANLAAIKERQYRLAELIQDSKLESLSEPGVFRQPTLTNQGSEPIGIQDLPLEQAATNGQVIIAAGSDSPQSASQSSLDTNAKGGEAVLPANETEVTVKTPLVKDDAFIYIKAVAETKNKVIYVSAKSPAAGFFKVAIDTPVDFAIKFNWWIIN